MNRKALSVFLVIFLFIKCQPGKSESEAPEIISYSDSVATETIAVKTIDTVTYEFSSFEEGYSIFEELNYTPEAWQSGIREIPNLHLMRIPQRWRKTTSQQIEVRLKKAIFFRILAPLALVVNAEIQNDRAKLEEISEKGIDSADAQEKEWIQKLAVRYKVIKPEQEFTSKNLDELFTRVNQLPLSLVLAQSAEESGWGTSRFAAEGNALFGQWAWGADAIKPKEQREGMGNYGIARFDTPLGSMRAYMHNLNTHNAYKELRKVRAELTASGKHADGPALAQTLTKYSERGQAYVETLLSIMRVNKLIQADSAYLKEEPVILMVPLE